MLSDYGAKGGEFEQCPDIVSGDAVCRCFLFKGDSFTFLFEWIMCIQFVCVMDVGGCVSVGFGSEEGEYLGFGVLY